MNTGLPASQTSPSAWSPEKILSRLGEIVQELPALNDPRAVKALADQAESIRYLTRKLGYNRDIQNAAAEATLWTRRRLGELLPAPQPRGGDRRSISSMDDETRRAKETLTQVSRQLGLPQVEASRCTELARLPREEFVQHVDIIKKTEGELSTAALFRRLTALRRGSRNPDLEKKTPPLPEGVYELLYADPPWEYEFGVTSDRAIEKHYPTMTIEQLCALPVAEIAAPDAMIFLWITSPKLEDAFVVMRAWGFRYRSSMVWVKVGLGLGTYARINHEFLLIGRKGAFPTPEPASRPRSVITAPRGRHSEKPACIYAILEKMYPTARKVELFARQRRDGWTTWGNEASRS